MTPKFYDFATSLFLPFVVWWGRLRVVGLECVPATGPLLVVANHDSQWDPVVVGVALRSCRRVRYLARANLWRIPGFGVVMNGLGQIPVERGAGDSDALQRARVILQSGETLGVFPEGRLSWGESVRARSGVGLLATWCPDAPIVLCQVEGTTDFVRFPRRPQLTVTFFRADRGASPEGESPAELAARLLAELRRRVPPTAAGRKAIIGGPPRVRAAQARRDAQSRSRGQSLRDG